MARDGTYRGGRRTNSGRKPTPAADRINGGETAHVMRNDLTELDAPDLDAYDLPDGAVLEGSEMPPPADYLSARQKNGKPLGADRIYEETWEWLRARRCENIVSPRLIESYAQAFARYIQCEEAISTYGLLGKHPTTGGVVTSPFVTMSHQYQKQANLIWYEIWDIVKANCTEQFDDQPNDLMEQLLRERKGD